MAKHGAERHNFFVRLATTEEQQLMLVECVFMVSLILKGM